MLKDTKTCRVCLRTECDRNLKCLFEKVEGEQTFADILNNFTQYEVSIYDKLPQKICKSCSTSALNAFKFKRKCEESYYKLLERFRISIIKCNSLEKTEKFTQTEDWDNLKSNRDTILTNLCRFCGLSFDSDSSLEAHISLVHMSPRQSFNTCHICKRQFTLIDHLRRHLVVIHKIVELNTENNVKTEVLSLHNNSSNEDCNNLTLEPINDDKTDIIQLCMNEIFIDCNNVESPAKEKETLSVRKEHKNEEKVNESEPIEQTSRSDSSIIHNEEQTIRKKLSKRVVPMKRVNGTHKKIKCTDCEKSFANLSQYEQHKIKNHSNKNRCTICEKTFSTKIYLQRHLAMHEKKRFVCKACSESYSTKDELIEHVKAEGHDKPLLCPECGLRCKTENILTVHMRRHTGEKPFKCKFCSKGFPRTDDLRVHEKYHTGEKSHFCETCGKGFQRKYNLTIHLRVHTGEKPYKCPHCSQAFAQANDLKAHIRRHTGERFTCEYCDASFLQNYQIRQHKFSEHGIREDPPTQRVAKFISTEAQNLKIKQNQQKEPTEAIVEDTICDDTMNIELDSLSIDICELQYPTSDIINSLEASDFSTIPF